MIKVFLKGEQTDWDLYLGCLAGAYPATPHESTGLTPNLIMLGREARLPADITFYPKIPRDSEQNYGEYTESVRERLQKAHRIARQNLDRATKRQKSHYDMKATMSK